MASVVLKGLTWDHARGFDPMTATAQAFNERHPRTEIVWHKRSLQAFADRPLSATVEEYDLLVIDHLDARCFTMNPIGAYEWLANRNDKSYVPYLYGYSNYSREGFRPHRVDVRDAPTHAGNRVGGTTRGARASRYPPAPGTGRKRWSTRSGSPPPRSS